MSELPKIEQREKYRPKIDFVMDKEEDKNYFQMFWRHDHSARSSELKFLEDKLKKGEISLDEGSKIADDFMDEYYAKNSGEISMVAEAVKKGWLKVKDDFFTKTDRMLKGWSWPQGEYRGVASTLNIFPRNIKDKSFAFPADKNNPYAIKIIAHEMLHFIVYDYLEKKLNLKPSEYHDTDNTFWQFTENLNVLIENSGDWEEFGIGKGSRPYDDCKAMYDKMKELWDNGVTDIDDLAREILITK